METNSIITAPQTDNMSGLYAKWKSSHSGSIEDFYDFMTTPTTEREEFISSMRENVDFTFKGNITEITIIG